MDKTSRLELNLPERGYRDWDVPINENFSLIDGKVAGLDLDNVFTGSNIFTKAIKSNYTLALESITNNTTFEKPAEAPTENKNIGRINFLASDSGYSMGHLLTYRNTSNVVLTQIAARQSIDGVQKSCVLELGVDQDGNPITKVPVPEDTSNSTKIPTTSWVRKLFALLTGNNTFSGLNTYTGAVRLRHLGDDSTKAPAEQIYYQWGMEDKNGVWLGGYEANHLTDGSYTKGMYVKQQGGDKWGSLYVGITTDGSEFTRAPTPPTSDNSTQIATTAFVNNKFQVVTALPSSPTAGVFYFIKE